MKAHFFVCQNFHTNSIWIRWFDGKNKDYYDLEARTTGNKVMCEGAEDARYIVETECIRKFAFSEDKYALAGRVPLTGPGSCIRNRSGCYERTDDYEERNF